MLCSRRQQGFESPWGRQGNSKESAVPVDSFFYLWAPVVGFFVSSCQNLKACLKEFSIYPILNDCLCVHAEKLPAVCPAGGSYSRLPFCPFFSIPLTFQKSAAAGAETIYRHFWAESSTMRCFATPFKVFSPCFFVRETGS
ncbi:MAG: hypothetical protein MUO63_09550 [Desulfobulbaceae bacterium]|nr:hypothetical protein [Desulfobulbaceae bacterium]